MVATDPPSYRSGEIDDDVSALGVESVFGVEENNQQMEVEDNHYMEAEEDAYAAQVSKEEEEEENDAETEKVSSDDDVAVGANPLRILSPAALGGEHRNPIIRSITATAEATLDRHYSVGELVRTLGQGGAGTENLPPELERRVRDFLLAQRKRREKYGPQQPWGIFGMYAHLANVRIDLEWAEDAAYRRQHNEPYLSWTDFDDARLQALHRPWFTYVIIVLCTIMLIVSFAVNDWKIEPLNVNNMIGPSKDTLIKIGARDTDLIINQHQWYRIVSPLILHAGIIHYVVNMIAFWFIGVAVEQTHGILNTIALFMIPGIGGTILSAIFLPQYISVGASGGIFGLIGGCMADIGMNWKLLFIHHADETKKQVWRRNFWAVFILVAEVLFNIILGLITPFIDNFSHLGGMLYGACCAFSTIEPLAVGFLGVHTSAFDKIRAVTIKFCGLIISLFLILVSTVWLATSDSGESPCSGCRYISCVPFPLFSEDKWWYCDDCDFVTAELYRNQTLYYKIDLTCPDDTVEIIDISDDMLTEDDAVAKQLPTYCREYCADRFS